MGCNQEKENPFEKVEVNSFSTVDKVFAIMSGKGGVGKSSVTSLVATTLCRKGKRVGILDADFTGPSIPKVFGLNENMARTGPMGIVPEVTAGGIKIMSINLLLEKKDHPVIWRGPILANTVKQFFTEVVWGDLDYLLIDLPPGTGDVPLTIMQSLPLDGIVIVSSPQDLVKLIVTKSIKMAEMLKIPIIGIVENMSYLECPDCKKIIKVFGESKIEQVARETGIPVLARIPIDPVFTELCDQGKVENYTKVKISLNGIQ
ncbi:Mrp/NBP35 family ATP-binding protein [Candidatus Formimonas warabiya]|uniref:Iron-sulfur cluster carrier protein n=1 Tax=Formimonas warabiya TaxID=1761012 RepID=A0A3G1KYL1_FORW1|nr:Mrp/NBP35 family ATP-binding protein [Candidatus Formimonas warabiya]ATW27531.1 ATP-binding protein [Candidatus Formimonas warabiya]